MNTRFLMSLASMVPLTDLRASGSVDEGLSTVNPSEVTVDAPTQSAEGSARRPSGAEMPGDAAFSLGSIPDRRQIVRRDADRDRLVTTYLRKPGPYRPQEREP